MENKGFGDVLPEIFGTNYSTPSGKYMLVSHQEVDSISPHTEYSLIL